MKLTPPLKLQLSNQTRYTLKLPIHYPMSNVVTDKYRCGLVKDAFTMVPSETFNDGKEEGLI